MFKNQLVLFLILTFIGFKSNAQFEFGNSNVNNLILGTNAVVEQNVFSVFENVANVSNIKSFQIGIAASNSFLISDLNTYYFTTSYNTSKQKIALGIAYNGFEQFNESIIKLAYSQIVNDNFNLGVSFNALRLYTFNTDNNFYANFDVGMQVKITDKMFLSTAVKNPLSFKTDNEFTDLNIGNVNFGFSYLVNKKMLFALEGNKFIEKDLKLNFGLKYQLVKTVDLLIGFATNPQTFNFGFKFNLGKTAIGTSSVYHKQLGIAPTFDFSFVSNNEEVQENKKEIQ